MSYSEKYLVKNAICLIIASLLVETINLKINFATYYIMTKNNKGEVI